MSFSGQKYIPPHRRLIVCDQNKTNEYNGLTSNILADIYTNNDKKSNVNDTSLHKDNISSKISTKMNSNDNINENSNDNDSLSECNNNDNSSTISDDNNNDNSSDDSKSVKLSRKLKRFPIEYIVTQQFYVKNSEYYTKLIQLRRDGYSNENVAKFFNLKHLNQSKSDRSSRKNVVTLFKRFYRYAIDIDICCEYIHWFNNIFGNKYKYFLDIGYAPGGMSRLILDSNIYIRGIGITLSPLDCGNAIINELKYDKRYISHECDITIFAKKIKRKLDFLKLCRVDRICDKDFSGFGLIICGITCHQDFNDNNKQRLDHQILLSELYIAFMTLENGGGLLIRHKIALDLIHQHLLFILLQCFNNQKSGKPLTEFAIRKTFWVYNIILY